MSEKLIVPIFFSKTFPIPKVYGPLRQTSGTKVRAGVQPSVVEV